MSFKLKTVLASMVLMASSASVVHAAGSGQINFSGEIIAAACSITPGTSDQSVMFGQVANAQLKEGGSSALMPFKIELTGCDLEDLTDNTVTATFTGTESVDVPKALGISGTAKGAGIVIMDDLNMPIELGKPTSPRGLIEGANALSFNAYLKGQATGDITVGEFSAVTNFSLAYQ